MNLWHSLYRECIITKAEITDKEELLQKIAALAVKTDPLKGLSEEQIFTALKQRESLGSTGLADGIAIPHCSFEDLKDFVVGVITSSRPISFGALDEKPSQIFIFLIGPTDNRNKHIRLLSSISKAVKDRTVRDLLLAADSPNGVMEIFGSAVKYSEPEVSGQGKSQITVYIQHEEYFDDILEAVSSEADGSVVVIETENANQYLYHMPLFASFWNERRRNFSRVLVAVVDRKAVNSVLRRIQTVVPDLQEHRGVMAAVQDLSFTLGSLDF